MAEYASKRILEKLFVIQQGLKAPKDKFNQFGKYKYRSAEGIIENAKPLMRETETVLVCNTTADVVNSKTRVTVTATLYDVETGDHIGASSSVGEDEERAGMCDSQNSGSTESFAKKYALGDLFAIDDSKDADDPELSKKPPYAREGAAKPSAPAPKAPTPPAPSNAPEAKKSASPAKPQPANILKEKLKEAWTIFKTRKLAEGLDANERSNMFVATIASIVKKSKPETLTPDEWDKVIARLKEAA